MAKVLVVGANRGIGLRIAQQLKARGDEVIAACRRSSPELDALGIRTELEVDVRSDDSVRVLDQRLGDTKLDWLIVIAGILRRQSLEDLDFDGIRDQLEVNSLGPLRVVAMLRHRLGRGGKVGILTSRMGSIADNSSGGSYGYRMSKAAVNAAGKSLSVDLAPKGISVVLLHPGFVRTEMTGNNGNISPEESAGGLIARLDELTPETSGQFRHMNGEELPW